ncbi:hypothetical protein AVEN_161930-1 [Araneus ventricosus]|uniref:Uncharacterized protein n=1 Tax=Araneus ventricosus TaxID=182803 RepID=A0A4Y2SWD4_ARAVE|nr:hypothetical protein AVEN_161930-1 [Araneus ventricosus]
MTRTTPPLTKLPHHTNGGRLAPTYDLTCNTGLIHEGFSVKSGFGLGTLRPQSRDLTTSSSSHYGQPAFEIVRSLFAV